MMTGQNPWLFWGRRTDSCRLKHLASATLRLHGLMKG